MEETQSVLRRAVLSEQTWAEVLDRFDRAGLTIDEFCSREGISRSSLARRRTLRNKQRGIASPLRTNKVAPTVIPPISTGPKSRTVMQPWPSAALG
ncbi:hypothetical protein RAE19_15410 [Rhodoferax sp. TBRC 17660]|uniref:Transposase n=1 Tax=Rhodoferax potami TaxID=3068338 RepID=A0ABU3KQJ9_9BURK|nr:hypothetical protein [Rhodoferax sp. TBRC 17660]MDT7520080.1 hypothetical protein [Rhodoferax sp. TBRC 17660]